jgi:hypothetical protein
LLNEEAKIIDVGVAMRLLEGSKLPERLNFIPGLGLGKFGVMSAGVVSGAIP